MIQNRPDEVRRFVAASTRGWEWALQHPEGAVAETAKDFPGTAAALHVGAVPGSRDVWSCRPLPPA